MSGRITIIGSQHRYRAEGAVEYANMIGWLAAELDKEILSGGGNGISRAVVEAYRKHGGRKFTAIFPSYEYMLMNGEERGPEPDEEIPFIGDYPSRNVELIRRSEIIVALDGGPGTMTEIIHARYDFKRPTAVIEYGQFPEIVRMFPELSEEIFFTDEADPLREFIERKCRRN